MTSRSAETGSGRDRNNRAPIEVACASCWLKNPPSQKGRWRRGREETVHDSQVAARGSRSEQHEDSTHRWPLPERGDYATIR